MSLSHFFPASAVAAIYDRRPSTFGGPHTLQRCFVAFARAAPAAIDRRYSRSVVVGVLLLSLTTWSTAAATPVTQTIDGLPYTFAPADEPIARALAPLVAKLRREAAAPAITPAGLAGPAPFSVEDLRVHRDDYLRQSAALIGLKEPTPLQRECYDGYLDNFARTERAFAVLVGHMRTLFDVRAIAIYRKADLIRRLRAGEKIPGATLAPDGEHGSFDFHPQLHGQDEELKALFAARQQRRLDLGYNYRLHDGVVDVSASTRVGAAPKPASAASDAKPIDWNTLIIPWLPLVIPPEKEALPPAEIAAVLVPYVADFLSIPRQLEDRPVQTPAALAYLILHETTEIGIVDRYLGSRDRRWFCEGVANYAAWKISRDRAGDAFARQVWDEPRQLADARSFREKVDLRGWPAAEYQQKDDADTPLTRAHYAFATHAIALMVARHGDDFLPRLFREIGRTPRARASIVTVERAYRKLAKEKLADLLAAALLPVGAPAAAAK